MTENMTREEALAEYLEVDPDDVTEGYGDELNGAGQSWLVLTDEEADEKVGEYIAESLWAFNASFLASQTDLPAEVFTAMQDQCEGANDTFRTLVERSDDGLDGFVDAAVAADGRGHFLNHWDGEEVELPGGYFGYRTN